MRDIEKKQEIRFIDLFGGVGGFRLGLEKANLILHSRSDTNREEAPVHGRTTETEGGDDTSAVNNSQIFRCIWYNDIDKWATAVYNFNFQEAWEPTDIGGVDIGSVPDFELLCAGFPCQSFSIAGRRQGFQDTRGTLFFEIARILEAKRPPLCLLENVKGLLSHDEGLTFQVILESLDELGYDAEWEVLNSKHFGVPQNRERVFIVGHLRGQSTPEVFPLGEGRQEPQAMEREAEEGGSGVEDEVACALRDGSKWSDSLVALSSRGDHSTGTKVIDVINARERKDGLAGTLKAEGTSQTSLGTALIHNIYGGFNEKEPRVFENESPTIRTPKGGGHLPLLMKNATFRRLTPIECERLQGFPDDFTRYGKLNGQRTAISDTQRYKMMGNAVTVNVVRAVGEKILEVIT